MVIDKTSWDSTDFPQQSCLKFVEVFSYSSQVDVDEMDKHVGHPGAKPAHMSQLAKEAASKASNKAVKVKRIGVQGEAGKNSLPFLDGPLFFTWHCFASEYA
jgi:hypothetical protein